MTVLLILPPKSFHPMVPVWLQALIFSYLDHFTSLMFSLSISSGLVVSIITTYFLSKTKIKSLPQKMLHNLSEIWLYQPDLQSILTTLQPDWTYAIFVMICPICSSNVPKHVPASGSLHIYLTVFLECISHTICTQTSHFRHLLRCCLIREAFLSHAV